VNKSYTKKERKEKMKAKTDVKTKEKTNLAETMQKKECKDKDCHIHGNLKVRGKSFEGVVISKHKKRLAIEFERMIYIRKYERYAKSKTKIHARLPICMEDEINIGDLIKVQECRPLSKIIHFVVIGKVNKTKEKRK